MRIEHSNGEDLNFQVGWMPRSDAGTIDVRVGRVLERYDFACCPICAAPEGLTDEHVPPESVGGKELTSSCGPCNWNLGSRVDRDYGDWFHLRSQARFTVEGVRGARKSGTVRLGFDDKARFVLLLDGNLIDPEVKASIDEEPGDLRMSLLDPAKWRLGLLKSAYLAIAIALRGIPVGADMDALRAELVAARDGRIQTDDASLYASELVAYRAIPGPENGVVRVCYLSNGNGTVDAGVMLGTVAVVSPTIHRALSWPLVASRSPMQG